MDVFLFFEIGSDINQADLDSHCSQPCPRPSDLLTTTRMLGWYKAKATMPSLYEISLLLTLDLNS